MESPSRTKSKVVALPSHSKSVMELLQRFGNAAATVLLLIVAVYFIVRWRMNSAEAGREATATQLSMAQSMVMQLRSPAMLEQPPQQLAARRDQISAGVTDALTNVLNGSSDAAQRAAALVTRGDLNWQLANLPDLPGAATQPSLRPHEESSILLGKAESSYQQVLSDSSMAGLHESTAAARLGLAAIAENKADWPTARKQLQDVIDHPTGAASFVAVARAQLVTLPTLADRVPLVPATRPAPMTPLLKSMSGTTPSTRPSMK